MNTPSPYADTPIDIIETRQATATMYHP